MAKKENTSATVKVRGKQALFVKYYMISLNAREAAEKAGYAKPDVEGSRLLTKPHVAAAIQNGMAKHLAKLHVDRDYVISNLKDIIEASIWDYIDVTEEGFVCLRQQEKISPEKLKFVNKLDSIKGGIKIELPDKNAALDKLAKHLGMYEKYRQSSRDHDSLTKKMLQDLMEHLISPEEAALRLDAAGLPIPESLRLILARTKPEPASTDDGAYAVISPEEMAERSQKRLTELEKQEADFVPNRENEIAELKAEIGGGSFQAQQINLDNTDSTQE